MKCDSLTILVATLMPQPNEYERNQPNRSYSAKDMNEIKTSRIRRVCR